MTRSLLAVLLAEAGRTVPDGQLVAALWGERPPATATASLHNHVMRLRRLLGDGGAARIRRSLDGYLIEVRPGELDLHDFEDAARRGRAALADGDWARAAEELARGLALWQGEPLVGLRACARQAAGADRLSEARLQAVEQLAEARLRLHAYGQVIADLGPMVRRHPWAENLHGHLMHALYGAGRQADALAAFQQLRRELRAELGVEPSTAVRELHHRILTGDPTLLSGPPAPPAGLGDGDAVGVGGGVGETALDDLADALRAALAAVRRLGDRSGEARVRVALAQTLIRLAAYREAERELLAAQQISRVCCLNRA
ncbi:MULTISPECIES: AfsR/SARP family transcriptional regulator [unclassified Kitasatospora]|uniref:AfsR/SARP family transcriptional regulator n=1 Tax=unclassified Kitasatospora TaxID=2633591 RepID=UPI0024744133|nr:AfsR/SARP family transcriptional regulator [Kitasatospora sp. MAP12-44]